MYKFKGNNKSHKDPYDVLFNFNYSSMLVFNNKEIDLTNVCFKFIGECIAFACWLENVPYSKELEKAIDATSEFNMENFNYNNFKSIKEYQQYLKQFYRKDRIKNIIN